MELRENISLAPLTTLGIGGTARWFAEAATEDDVTEAAAWVRKRGAALFVLGGGSNLVVADGGFDGLVLRVALRGIESGENGVLRAAAGEPWEVCVQQSLELGWAGVECLSGIPGTVGGTPVQNVGAYGQEVAPVIERVRVFDFAENTWVELSAAECSFAYRRSRFNTSDRGRFVVTRVDYRLNPGGAPTLRYAELQRAVEAAQAGGGQATLADVAAIVRAIRRGKGMLLVEDDPDCRSAGSFFKNPVIGEDLFQRIAGRSAPPRFVAEPGPSGEPRVKLSAAWLIEAAGFSKGFALGNAGISSRHTLALVNRGGARAEEILALAGKIAATVEQRFGIRLEMEPVLVGF